MLRLRVSSLSFRLRRRLILIDCSTAIDMFPLNQWPNRGREVNTSHTTLC